MRKNYIRLLGKISDRQLAKLIGCSYGTVRNERIRLEIEPLQPGKKKVNWTEKMDNLLGEMTDKDIAKKLRITQKSVFLRRRKLQIQPFMKRISWTPEIDDAIGTKPDSVIGKKFGISVKGIAYRRIRKLKRLSYKDKVDHEEFMERTGRIIQSLCNAPFRFFPVFWTVLTKSSET